MDICYDHNISYEGDSCPMCTLEGDVARRWRRFCSELEGVLDNTDLLED